MFLFTPLTNNITRPLFPNNHTVFIPNKKKKKHTVTGPRISGNSKEEQHSGVWPISTYGVQKYALSEQYTISNNDSIAQPKLIAGP